MERDERPDPARAQRHQLRAIMLDRGLDTIKKNLEREVAKNKITAENRDAALKSIQTVTDRAELAKCDYGAARERLEASGWNLRAVIEKIDK